MDSAI